MRALGQTKRVFHAALTEQGLTFVLQIAKIAEQFDLSQYITDLSTKVEKKIIRYYLTKNDHQLFMLIFTVNAPFYSQADSSIMQILSNFRVLPSFL